MTWQFTFAQSLGAQSEQQDSLGAWRSKDRYTRTVIDASGKLVYSGAIDDHPTTDVSDIPNSKNYVSAALTEAMGGQSVAVGYTRPYGCSVKYQGGE